MDRFRRIVMAVAVAALLSGLARGLYRPRASGFGVLVPAYFYPDREGRAHWNELVRTAGRVPLRVIVNPSSGPGTEPDPNYVRAVRRLQAADARVLGYVHTAYGRRDLGEVKADVEAYLRFYGVDGFFLDEMAVEPAAAGYYAKIRDRIKAWERSLEIVANPGVIVRESFVQRRLADTFIVFEGPADRFKIHHSPRWMRQYPRSRFGAIVHHAATAEEMERSLEVAAGSHLGELFVGDGTGANPYDRLPPFWPELMSRLPDALAEVTPASPANGDPR